MTIIADTGTQRRDVVVIGGGQAGLASATTSPNRAGGSPSSKRPASRPRRGGAAGTRCGCSRPCATTACPGSTSQATPTATRGATTSSPTSPTTRNGSSCRSSSTAACRPCGHATAAASSSSSPTASTRPTRSWSPRGRFRCRSRRPVAAGLGPEVVQLHSTRYRSPDDLPTGTVLVVGGGNTGYQISEELAHSRQVHLAIGARQMPLPQRILGRDLFRYLQATGLMYKTVDSRLAQRLKDKETLIGSSPRAARKLGIQLRPRATAAQGRSVTFADGSELTVDGVVWATGFRLDHSFVQLPVFDESEGVRIGAASPTSPACTSSACSGSTPAARRCWAGSRTTRSSSPNASTRSPRTTRHRRPCWPPRRVRDDRHPSRLRSRTRCRGRRTGPLDTGTPQPFQSCLYGRAAVPPLRSTLLPDECPPTASLASFRASSRATEEGDVLAVRLEWDGKPTQVERLACRSRRSRRSTSRGRPANATPGRCSARQADARRPAQPARSGATTSS